MNKLMTGLAILAPMAMAGNRGASDSWFSMKANANSSATIDIYDEIGGWGISAKEFANQLKALGNVHEIQLNIHSPGGDVFDGMAIYNLLSSHPATINVRIDGLAASMASVIAMVGDTITMPENSMMMVHKPWGIQGGNAEQMREYAELLDKVENTLLSAYVKKNRPTRWKGISYLEAETWFSAKECVELGFADVLDEPFEL
ncbi:prophage Clp protease-like protein [Vibrio astriarenae]|nr:prophage Clp protease-like protein [Vibrio sp. C7]